MPQFIKCHDIKENSDVIINKDQIQEVRVRENKHSGHHEHLEIKFSNGNVIDVKKDIIIDCYNDPVFFNLNKN